MQLKLKIDHNTRSVNSITIGPYIENSSLVEAPHIYFELDSFQRGSSTNNNKRLEHSLICSLPSNSTPSYSNTQSDYFVLEPAISDSNTKVKDERSNYDNAATEVEGKSNYDSVTNDTMGREEQSNYDSDTIGKEEASNYEEYSAPPDTSGDGDTSLLEDVYNHIGEVEDTRTLSVYSHLSIESEYDHLSRRSTEL